MWELERRAQANLWIKHRNRTRTTSKPEFPACSGSSMEGTYLLAIRCPVHRRRDSNSGFCTELENLGGDAKGKGASGCPMRPKVPRHWPGTHCFVVARKRGNSRGVKGAGHPRRNGVNGKPEELLGSGGRRRPSLGWHEPDESRGSRPDLWEARGAIPRAYPATGNRTKPNRTEVARRKPRQTTTGRLQSLRLFSTLLAWLRKEATAAFVVVFAQVVELWPVSFSLDR
jgi:hypothetical protein